MLRQGSALLRVRVPREVDFDVDVAAICRDDRCIRRDIHPFHEIVETASTIKRRMAEQGWSFHPLERRTTPFRGVRASAKALRHTLCSAVSLHTVKTFAVLKQEVAEDYGEVTDRTIFRALAKLIDQKQVLYVKPIRKLHGGYLKPGSKLPSYPDGNFIIAEQIRAAMVMEAKLKNEIAP